MGSDYTGAEFMHQHPWVLFITYGAIAIVIAAIIIGRWLFSKAAWPYHPGGSMGFLHDEFLRLGAIYIPYALFMIAAKYYIYDMHPELLKSPYLWVGLLSVFIFRRLTRFIPFVRARRRASRCGAQRSEIGLTPAPSR